MATGNVVPDFDEMKNAMTNAYLKINSHDLSNEVDSATAAFEDYKFIADTIIGKGAIPCSHYTDTGLYKNTCDWCKAVQTYKALERTI